MSENKASLDSVHELATALPDPDPQETREWLDSLDDLIKERGPERTRDLLLRMLSAAGEQNVAVPANLNTPFTNTIKPQDEPSFPGDERIERDYRRWMRWNAAVQVTRAQREGVHVGGVDLYSLRSGL